VAVNVAVEIFRPHGFADRPDQPYQMIDIWPVSGINDTASILGIFK
jgi:hypothetical protein